MKKVLFLLFSVCILSLQGKAQHKITMINGKEILASEYSVGDMFVTYKKAGDEKSSTKAVDKYDVFSVVRQDGSEELIYTPADSLDFTVAEAREYILGEQVANKEFNRRPTKISSAIVGAGASLLSFYSLPVPILYSVIIGRFDTKHIVAPSAAQANLIQNEAYRMGYQRTARNLKIQQSLKWGYISLGVGLTALIIYGANSTQ